MCTWMKNMDSWQRTDVLTLACRYLHAHTLYVCVFVSVLSLVYFFLILCLSVCQAICVHFPFMATCLPACNPPPPPLLYYLQQNDSCLAIAYNKEYTQPCACVLCIPRWMDVFELRMLEVERLVSARMAALLIRTFPFMSLQLSYNM